MAYIKGNIQERSDETPTEKMWREFGEELKRENPRGFNFKKGTSNSNNNGLEEHTKARNTKFDFVFNFTDWDTQIYENIPSYKKGDFTGGLKDWMWDFNFNLNIEVKRVGMGNIHSVLPKRFREAFNVPHSQINDWLITDFSNVLKLQNFGGIIYIFENGEEQIHHIFHDDDIADYCIGGYHMDWEGDPNEAGGGGYKAKTLLNKRYSVKFKTFEEVKDYIRSMAEFHLNQQKQKNRELYHKNITHKKTYILPYSDGKKGKQSPVILFEGILKPAPQKQINCKQVSKNE